MSGCDPLTGKALLRFLFFISTLSQISTRFLHVADLRVVLSLCSFLLSIMSSQTHLEAMIMSVHTAALPPGPEIHRLARQLAPFPPLCFPSLSRRNHSLPSGAHTGPTLFLVMNATCSNECETYL